MNPVDLLAVTESLVETKETAGRYRLPKRSLLPKFGAPKNPFAPSPGDAGRRPARAPLPAPLPQPSAPAAPPSAPARPEPPRSLATPGPTPAVAAPAPVRKWVPAFRISAGGWVRRLGDWLWRATKQAVPARRGTAPVQVELSLDNVKVVRNDLRDSDLEVVPLRSAATNKVSAIVEPSPASPAGRKPWNRVTGRFWRPEPTRAR